MEDTQKEVTLGGRVFVASNAEEMTFDQYAWVQMSADKAGLGTELVERLGPVLNRALDEEVALSENEAEELTNAIVMRCYEQRAHVELLSGILVQKGEEWTYESATENREFLGTMKGKADIEVANIILAQAIVGFFWSGLDSMLSSQKSSPLAQAVRRVRTETESEPEPDQENALVTSES